MLQEVIQLIQEEWSQKEPVWKNLPLSKRDFQFLEKECNAESEFDPMWARRSMLNGMKTGHTRYEGKVCPYGQVIALYADDSQRHDLPWGLWGRILRLYSDCADAKPFRIYFLAAPHLRLFPAHNEPITAIHINGGYTYHCNRETIMIYRAEDATRVLLHELMHSCCMDKMENGVDLVEAETEAWAELLHAAVLSEGDEAVFRREVKKQSDWMQAQNAVVRRHMKKPMDFPWRYTIGKEEVWRRWGILQRASPMQVASLRLTPPPTASQKAQHGVGSESMIL